MYTYGMYTYGMYTYGMYTYFFDEFLTNFFDEIFVEVFDEFFIFQPLRALGSEYLRSFFFLKLGQKSFGNKISTYLHFF